MKMASLKSSIASPQESNIVAEAVSDIEQKANRSGATRAAQHSSLYLQYTSCRAQPFKKHVQSGRANKKSPTASDPNAIAARQCNAHASLCRRCDVERHCRL